MPEIKFTATPELPRDIAHLAYKAGDVVDLPDDSCRRWIRRGVAVFHVRKATEMPQMIADGLRADGPTVGEWVAAGYVARSYPPSGYETRSTADEILAAITAQEPANEPANDVPEAPEAVDVVEHEYVPTDDKFVPVPDSTLEVAVAMPRRGRARK